MSSVNRIKYAASLAGLLGLKARHGETQWEATLLSAAELVLRSTGGAGWPVDRVEVEANQEIIRSAQGKSELKAAQQEGKVMILLAVFGKLMHPERLELPTACSEDKCSVQLSYGCKFS
jgi:hypothetical protein